MMMILYAKDMSWEKEQQVCRQTEGAVGEPAWRRVNTEDM